MFEDSFENTEDINRLDTGPDENGGTRCPGMDDKLPDNASLVEDVKATAGPVRTHTSASNVLVQRALDCRGSIDVDEVLDNDALTFLQDTAEATAHHQTSTHLGQRTWTRGDDPPNRNFICVDCTSSFQYPKDLARHQSTVHAQARPFVCPVESCRYHIIGFGRLDNRARHIRNMHKEL